MSPRKGFWKERLWVIALCLITLISAACGNAGSKTERALQYADALQAAVDAFEQARLETSTRLEETSSKVNAAVVQASVAPPAELDRGTTTAPEAEPARAKLTGLADIWASEWQAVHAKFTTLEDTFSVVGQRSYDYFAELDAITEGIGNPGIKAAEAEKNRQLKEAWTAAYVQASDDLGKLRGLVLVGDDFEVVLTLEQMRITLHEDIRQLEVVSAQAQDLLHQLEQLTIEGRHLTGGQPQPTPGSPLAPEAPGEKGT